MRIRSKGGIQVDIAFEGDVFETEDQRNWSDSSYKTYSTPLELPFPALVKKGDRVKQRVTIQLTGQPYEGNSGLQSAAEEKIPFPKIGFARSFEQLPFTSSQIDLLLKIPFDYYRVELNLADKTWKNKFSAAAIEAASLDTRIVLVFAIDGDIVRACNALVESIASDKHLVTHLFLHRHGSDTLSRTDQENAYTVIKKSFPGLRVGYGTQGHFAELNRKRPPSGSHDFVAFSLSPQVHAVDTPSLLENLTNQRDLISTAASFTSAPVHVHVTLKQKRLVPGNESSGYAAPEDSRQYSSLVAYWTLRCIQQLAQAEQIILYDVAGPAGLIHGKRLSAFYQVLAKLHSFEPVWLIRNNTFLKEKFIVENARGERLQFALEAP
jgi:hypothetical protein